MQTLCFFPNTCFFIAIPNMCEFKLFKDIFILNRNFTSKWRICNNNIEVTDRVMIPKHILIYAQRFRKT